MNQMVDALEKAMAEDIRTLPWMTEDTKKAALVKLSAITNNVGAPKKWRDYSKLAIARDDFFGNAMHAAEAGVAAADREDRAAHRQDRVEHDHPDGERLLQPAEQHHQLPRGHSAAAVLRSAPRYRPQLRRRRRR